MGFQYDLIIIQKWLAFYWATLYYVSKELCCAVAYAFYLRNLHCECLCRLCNAQRAHQYSGAPLSCQKI